MGLGRRFRRLIDLPTRTEEVIDRDLDDEVSFHIGMRVKDLVRSGMSESEAQITALPYRVDERDWVTPVSVAGVLILASLAACFVPARAAARLGPQEALRGE